MPTEGAVEMWKARCRSMSREELRELLVTERLATYKRHYATLELEGRDREATETSSAEQIALARLAADSAAIQAEEARKANLKADTANTIASIAMAAAVIAIGISIVGLFVGR